MTDIYVVPALLLLLLLLLLCTHLKGFAALIGPAAAKSRLPSKLIFRVVWWHTACVIPLRCRLFHKNISVAVHPHLQWRGGLDERLIVVASIYYGKRKPRGWRYITQIGFNCYSHFWPLPCSTCMLYYIPSHFLLQLPFTKQIPKSRI